LFTIAQTPWLIVRYKRVSSSRKIPEAVFLASGFPAFADRKLAMPVSQCPSLQRLGLLLLDTHALRTEAEGAGDYHSLFSAERYLSHANRLITLHRALCSQCGFADAQQRLPQRVVSHPKVISIDRVG
jgi:hypothetical protein